MENLSLNAKSGSTLSSRGLGTAKGNDNFELFVEITKNAYHPKTNADGIVCLSGAETTLMHPETEEFCNKSLSLKSFELACGLGPGGSLPLRRALSSHFDRYFNAQPPSLTTSQIIVLNGLSSALDALAWCLCDAGDVVLIAAPMYAGYSHAMHARSQVELVGVTFKDSPDKFWTPDCVDVYEAARKKCVAEGKKVKAINLCNPHNPLGKCYSADTLAALAKYCSSNSLHLISDEIYALSTFPASTTPFTSLLSIPNTDPTYTHVLYGSSKDWGCNGFRLGCLASRNMELQKAVGGMGLYMWPSSPADMLWTKMLSEADFSAWFIPEMQKRLENGYNYITQELDVARIPYYKGGNAGLFVLVDLRECLEASTFEAEAKLHHKLLYEAKVAIAPGIQYAMDEPGWFRMTFSDEEDLVHEGVQRIKTVVDACRADRNH